MAVQVPFMFSAVTNEGMSRTAAPTAVAASVGGDSLALTTATKQSIGRFKVAERNETEMISRRKAFSFLGLAALGLAAAPTLLMTSEGAEAQTTQFPQTGTERRQERRGARQERRQERRTYRTERRTERRTNRTERRTERREGRTERREERRGTTPQ
jgi:hypothetical protein